MPDVKIIVTAVDKASAKLKTIGGSMTGLGKAAVAAGAVGVAAVGAIAVGATKLALDAAKLEPVKITFDSLTKSIGSTSDKMLKALRPATMGVLSDAELMKAANKLMAMGLAESEEEAAKLAEMAVTLGTAMGEEAGPAMENFTLMLANQSIPRLDTFGISSGQVRERIAELMEETEGLTREQAFMAAVMEQGGESMEKVGDVSGTAKVTMGKFRATIDNLKQSVGEALLPALKAFLDKVIIPLIPKIVELGSKIGEWLGPFMKKVAEVIGPKVKAVFEAIKNFVVDHLIPAIRKLYEWFKDNILPIFQEFAEEMGPRVKDFLQKLGEFIRDTLVPALQAFWDKTEGIREAIASFMASSAVLLFKTFLEGLVTLWDLLWAAMHKVWEILGWIADRLGGILDRFRDWEPPSWFRWFLSESMSPMEKGLRDVADAFAELSMTTGAVATMTHQWGGGPAVVRVEGLSPTVGEDLEGRIAEAILEMLYPGR